MQLSFLPRKDVCERIPPGAKIILNVSGGKDSIGTMLYICQQYPQHEKHVIYNDTGFEHDGIFEYIQQIVSQCNLPLTKLDSPGLFSIIRQRGQIPSQLCRFCTSRLKRDVSAKWIRKHYPEGEIFNLFGLRAEESHERAKLQPKAIDTRLTTQKRTVYRFNPVLYWSTDEVREFVKGEGFELFHTYEYLSRLSCRYCFLAGKRDHDAVRLNDPEGFQQVNILKEEIHWKE